jgi:hypothetical protein
MSSGKHTVIEIDGGRLTAVWGEVRPGSVVVDGWCTANRPDGLAMDDARAVGTWVQQELSTANVPRGKVTLAAGRSEVVLKLLTLPRVEGGAVDGELAAMVRLQMMRQITVGGETAAIDYVAGRATEDGVPTLAAAMPGERLDWYREMSRAAGLKPIRLALKCDAIAALLADITQRRDGAALGVCVGASSTEFIVIERGRLEAARAVELVRPGAEDAGPFAERLAVEARRTWASHRASRTGGELEAVLVVGEDPLSERIALGCAQSLDCRGETVRLPRMIAIPQSMGEASRGMAAALVGILVQHAEGVPTLDFLHPRRAPDRGARIRQLVLAGIAATIVLGGVAYVLADASLSGLRTEAELLLAQETQLRKERDDMLVRHARVKHLATWMSEPVDWLKHARVLSDAAPEARAGLVRELSGRADFAAAFSPNGAYPRGKWSVDQPIVVNVDGSMAARQVGSLFRERLLDGGVYQVTNKGAEVPDRYSLVLTTRLRDATAPPPAPVKPAPGEAKPVNSKQNDAAPKGEEGRP